MTIRVLLTYHSGEGQTAKIAHRVADVLRSRGATVDLGLAEHDPSPLGYTGVVVGDSIHVGKHSRELRFWLRRHREVLATMPVALFQVSLTSAKDDDESVHDANQMVGDLLGATGLDPDMVGLFAGALAYSRYGWLKRRMMSRVAAADGKDTDTSHDYEYTDWNDVEHFTADAYSMIEQAAGHG